MGGEIEADLSYYDPKNYCNKYVVKHKSAKLISTLELVRYSQYVRVSMLELVRQNQYVRVITSFRTSVTD